MANPRSSEFHKKDLVEKIQYILLDTREFFKAMPQTGGYREPLVFALAVIAISQILSAAINIPSTPDGLWNYIYYGELSQNIAYIIGALIGAPIGLFLGAALLQFLLRRLGGKGTYESTFRALSYSAAVSIFSWVPFLGLPAAVYRLYLLTVGCSELHQISRGRALAALAALILLFFVIMLLLAFSGFYRPDL